MELEHGNLPGGTDKIDILVTLPDIYSSYKIKESDVPEIKVENNTTEIISIVVTADCGITQEYNLIVIIEGEWNAQQPNITIHPQNDKEYEYGDTADLLSVKADNSDGGVLNYQWYRSNTPNNTGGTQILGANSNTYQPPTTEVRTTYYYCEIKNDITNIGDPSHLLDGGTKIEIKNSDYAEVVVNPRTITVSGTVSNTLSPIDSAKLEIKLENFIDNPGGIGLSVSAPTGVTHTSTGTPTYSNGVYTFEVTLNYNLSTNTAFANGTASIPVSVTGLPNTYTASSEDFTINIADGQADFTGAPNEVDRRIPVHAGNIAEFNTYANTTAGLTRHYKLVESFILDPPVAPETSNWDSVGKSSSNFTGSFDGGGNTITGLKITSNENDIGFFGVTEGISVVIKNLNLRSVDISGVDNVGSIVGRNKGGRIQNCSNDGEVSGTSNIGGITGRNESNGTVEYCWNEGKVEGNGRAGGITGINTGGTVKICYNTGNIYGGYQLSTGGGGITGQVYNGTVSNCYNTGNVYGKIIGGIAGDTNAGSVSNCYNTGEIYPSDPSEGVSGGITGWNGGITENSVSLGIRVYGTVRYGRVVGYNNGGTLTNNFGRYGLGGAGENGSNKLDGEDITSAQWGNQSWWTTTAAWNQSIWNFSGVSATTYPKLRGTPEFEAAQNPVVP